MRFDGKVAVVTGGSPSWTRWSRAMETRDMGDGVVFASERRRSDPEITRLIDRIRRLVAEQQRLEDSPELERRDANGREIDRLQRRLATAVKRDLSG